MIRSLLLCAALALPSLVHADVGKVIETHIQPGFTRFAQGTETLADAALADCRAEALRPAYQTAFDAWMGVSHLQFGPLEAEGRTLTIAFWPDTRGVVPRTLTTLIAEEDNAVTDPGQFTEISVAGRGFFVLERLLYDADFNGYAADSYSCQLAQAITSDLARTAATLAQEWEGYANTLASAGADGNSTYLSAREADQELYTALITGLEFIRDKRLGRPMGTFERPRPKRAEAWRSGRSLRNVVLVLEALRGLAGAFPNAPAPRTDAAFAAALKTASELDDPAFAGVADVSGRLRVEMLQQRVQRILDATGEEIGAPLGISAGFNSQDGD